jgi:hypothetical protein
MHHPVAVADAVAAALDRGWHEGGTARAGGPEPFELLPWWRGFSGVIEAAPSPAAAAARAGGAAPASYEDGFVTHGAAAIDDEGGEERAGAGSGGGGGGVAVRVRELPLGRWTDDYKAFVQGLVADGSLRGFREHHTESSVDFALALSAETTDKLGLNGGLSGPRAAEALRRFLRLSTPVSTRNMHLFDARGRIRRFASPWDVVRDFAPARAALYAARRVRVEGALAEQLVRASARARFLAEVVSGRLVVGRRPRAELEAELLARGFPSSAAFAALDDERGEDARGAEADAALVRGNGHLVDLALLARYRRASAMEIALRGGSSGGGGGGGPAPPPAGPGAAPASPSSPSPSFEYLLSLPLSQLTSESLARTNRAAADTAAALEEARRTSAEQLWRRDLEALRTALVAIYGEAKKAAPPSRARRGAA